VFIRKQELNPGEKFVEQEGGVQGGAPRINNAYDLQLIEHANGNYELRLFMKLQFFFKDDGMNKWKESEKKQFISSWELRVRKIWDGHLLKVLNNNKQVYLGLMFNIQVGGFMLDHWEITVKKLPAGTVFRSYVHPRAKNVMLTENDNNIVVRNVRNVGAYQQITSTHEFGHMIGLDDEYGVLFGGKQGKHNADYDSVMNIGSKVRQRHMGHILSWLNKALVRHGVQ
jgi:hypothetical protein